MIAVDLTISSGTGPRGRSKANGETVICNVNADSPEEAYLLREIRWLPTLFVAAIGMLFSGVGFLLARQHWRQRR